MLHSSVDDTHYQPVEYISAIYHIIPLVWENELNINLAPINWLWRIWMQSTHVIKYSKSQQSVYSVYISWG